MLSEKNKASLRSYENRLENEHTDPEFIPQEECRHCDELTEQDANNPDLCGACLLPYGHTDAEAIEHLQNRLDKETKKTDECLEEMGRIEMERIQFLLEINEQAATIAELKAKLGAVLPEGYPCTLPGGNTVYWVIQAMDSEGAPRYLNTSYLGGWERAGTPGSAERFRNPKLAKEALLALRNDFRNNGLTDTTERTSRVRNLTHWKITEVVERGFYKPMDPELLEWCVRVGRDISELLKATDTKK